MKLEELFEKMSAGVYVNDDQSLTVISKLVQKKFGVDNKWGGGGICLLSQILFTIEAVTHIKPADVAKQMDDDHIDYRGFTLDQIFKMLNGIVVNGKKIHLSLNEISDVDEAVHEVRSGQPVIMILDNKQPIMKLINKLGAYTNDGIASDHPGTDYQERAAREFIRTFTDPSSRAYHALMLIGYDSAHKMLILRDTRPAYSFKGYAKLPLEMIKRVPKIISKMLTVNVESVEKV